MAFCINKQSFDLLKVKCVKHLGGIYHWASQVAQWLRNLPANSGDMGWILGLGKAPRKENDNPLQYSCLENSSILVQYSVMGRGAWRAIVYGSTNSWT